LKLADRNKNAPATIKTTNEFSSFYKPKVERQRSIKTLLFYGIFEYYWFRLFVYLLDITLGLRVLWKAENYQGVVRI